MKKVIPMRHCGCAATVLEARQNFSRKIIFNPQGCTPQWKLQALIERASPREVEATKFGNAQFATFKAALTDLAVVQAGFDRAKMKRLLAIQRRSTRSWRRRRARANGA